MWGFIPGGGTIGTTRWAAGKAKGRPRPKARGTFADDLAAFAKEVEREAARRKREKAKAKA
jgi:hypothetical protein